MASAGIVDAQLVQGADTLGASTRGFDAGKKVNGRKRHAVVDTLGLLIVVLVTAASVQDRDGGRLVLDKARMAMPSIVLVWADGGYAGRCVEFARRLLRITRHIVRKPEGSAPSRSCPGVGSWREPCPDWFAAVAWTTTTNACPNKLRPWSSGP